MYGEQCVLLAIGHSRSVGLRGVRVSRVHVAADGVPRRVFHNQRFTFSSLRVASRGNDVVGMQGRIFECDLE